jgi:hypothetical protein
MSRLNILKNADPLLGIEVQLPRRCQCGHDILYVAANRSPHGASLYCAVCGRNCGWLSNEIANFLTCVIARFGRPTAPVCVRMPCGTLP